MKRRIYRTLCLLTICGLVACGKKNQPPTAMNTPTATPTPMTTPGVPSPVATIEPPKQLPPVKQPAASAIKTPKPIVQTAPVPPKIAALPESIYPNPTPVAIPVVPEPFRIKTNSKTEPITKIKLPTDPARQITPVGIGSAKIGMTFKELKATIGSEYQFPVKTNFIDGFDAIAVTKAGTVQYYIPYPTGTNFTDADRIQHLMTDNPSYHTAQGVGPGTPIGKAASIYGGGATLSMSKENESREFINFNQHPDGLAFRPKPVGTRSFAGDYPESNDDYLKTQKYDKRAAIGQITVSCPEDKCEPDR
jgi:hypothetical protein